MRLKTVKSNRHKGRPANIPMDVQRRDLPENYPTLLRYLEATGKLRHTNYVQMMRARHLYIRGVDPAKIAVDVNLEPSIIERWALCFAWEEERDRRMFEAFRKVSGLRDRISQDTSERHDRIAGSIEQVAERILHQHQNGKLNLSTRDLATIASTLKQTQEIRRVARGLTTSKSEKEVNISVSVPHSMERLAAAIVDITDRPMLKQATTKQIAVEIGNAIGTDEEFDGTPEKGD